MMRGFGSKLIVVLGLGVALMGGCASYTNVPEAGRAGEVDNVNAWGTRSVLSAAISEVVRSHPARDAQGRYVVNFPIGTSREQALRVVQDLPSGAMLPGEGGADGAPVYHVARLWLRASSAKVDVVFPSTVDGKTYERAVTVWLRGGPLPWDVQRMQYWAPGVITTPELYVPVWLDEAEAARRAERGAARSAEIRTPSADPELAAEAETDGGADADVVERDGVLYRQVDD
jgi:hypothetical protein